MPCDYKVFKAICDTTWDRFFCLAGMGIVKILMDPVSFERFWCYNCSFIFCVILSIYSLNVVMIHKLIRFFFPSQKITHSYRSSCSEISL